MTATETRPLAERSAYLEGPYAPIQTEITAVDCQVEGELPSDLAGVFVRTGANPRFDPPGRYHWFDGDGMVHAVEIADGRATYRNRYVRTAGLAADEAAGRALRTGILERPDFGQASGPYKDTANTDLVFHDGKLLALWWLSGAAHRLSVPGMDTLGVETFGDTLATNIAAHAKVDPATDELLFLDYSPIPPYLRFGVVAGGEVVHQVDVDLPGPRLQHDLAFTDRFAVLFDFSMMWDPELLAQGKVRMAFRRDTPTHIGLLPRRGAASEARWFEVEPCFMYHTINAWEEGDTVVLTGYRIAEPILEGEAGTTDAAGRIVPHLAHLRLAPDLHEWRFDLATGAVTERVLDETYGEFGRMHDGLLGTLTTTAWTPRLASAATLRFDALIDHDTTTGEHRAVYELAPGSHGGEWSFAPRSGATAAAHAAAHRSRGSDARTTETDGYLTTFVTIDGADHGFLDVVDAADVGAGPIARVRIPQRMPAGYHTRWIAGDDL